MFRISQINCTKFFTVVMYSSKIKTFASGSSLRALINVLPYFPFQAINRRWSSWGLARWYERNLQIWKWVQISQLVCLQQIQSFKPNISQIWILNLAKWLRCLPLVPRIVGSSPIRVTAMFLHKTPVLVGSRKRTREWFK